MKSNPLQGLTRRRLADLARKQGIAGWYAMRKGELVHALTRRSKADAAQPQPAAPPDADARKGAAPLTRELAVHGAPDGPDGFGKDRIVAMVRDPYWLHCYWEVSRKAMQRAEAALGLDWHGSRLVLRLIDVSSRDASCTSETVVRDIPVHGGCNNWYVEVAQPPRSYRIDIGYLSRRGQFCTLARSNVVTPPRAGFGAPIDAHWSDLDAHQAERIYAMSNGFDSHPPNRELKELFEERLGRPPGKPAVLSFGSGASRPHPFRFELEAELLIHGATEANAHVTVQGEPIKLRPDGTFTMRVGLPENRQVIPATAVSGDGGDERTIVLAIERNTKKLAPMCHRFDAD